MKNLLKYFNGYKKECVFGPLFKLLEASFELFIPLVVVRIIDIGIANKDTSYIMKMCLIMVLLGIIGLACSISAQFFSAKAAVGFAAKIRQAMFTHIQKLTYSDIDTLGTSTMITRMTSDVNQLQNGVNMTLRLFLRSPFIVFGAAIMAFTIDVKSALIFVVVIPLLSIVVYGIMIITIPMYKKVQSMLDRVLGKTRDNINGIRVIRAFGLEQIQDDEFENENNKYVRQQLVVGRISALTNPVTFVIINLGTAYLIWTGAIRVDGGVISQGQLIALVNYMSQILVELIKLANFIVLDIKALACADRIDSVLNYGKAPSTVYETENEDKAGADKSGADKASINKKEPVVFEPIDNLSENAVEFKNASLLYDGAGGESLSDISFVVKKGETVGIIGGTGCGKTSLINMIPGFYHAASGQVLINGKDVKSYDDVKLREMVGVVPQKAVLFTGTIRENMLWGNGSATDDEIRNALDMAQALSFVEEKEGKLDFELTKGGTNLSGGQRQRLTIARALVKKPQILILDDSSSALDAVTDRALRESLKKLDSETTVFIVSQRSASIMHADKILVLDDGKLLAVGTHNQLLESCSVYKEIYDSQFASNK